MRTIETTLYTFDELSDDAKQKAIEDAREREYKYGIEFLPESMQDQLEYLLTERGAKNLNVTVRYSLGYSQGDGASFTGSFDCKAWRVEVDTNSWGVHYSHNRSVDVKEMNSLKTDADAPDHKWAAMQDMIEAIGAELETYGYAEIEHATSDETLEELLIANEYEFTADGSMA